MQYLWGSSAAILSHNLGGWLHLLKRLLTWTQLLQEGLSLENVTFLCRFCRKIILSGTLFRTPFVLHSVQNKTFSESYHNSGFVHATFSSGLGCNFLVRRIPYGSKNTESLSNKNYAYSTQTQDSWKCQNGGVTFWITFAVKQDSF